MKKLTIPFLILFLLPISCSRVKKPQSALEREKWIESFNDSVSYYQNLNNEVNEKLTNINNKIQSILNDFEYVKNPRQVTGYYILKGWNSKIPFSSTALYARITDNENLELIATLKGGNFNKISAECQNLKISSGVVPYDQALNYRHNGINTVCFSGSPADSVAQFISMNSDNKINIIFSEGNSDKIFTLPQDEKQMGAQTWNLFELKLEARTLQKELWINSRKIQTYIRIMESQDSLSRQ